MKSSVLFVVLFSCFCSVQAQVAINNNGASPDANTMLDVQSTSKGLKFPRMTSAQRKAIPVNVADAGLFVYDTDKQKLYMYNGNAWQPFAVLSEYSGSVQTSVSALANISSLGDAVAISGNYAVATAQYDTVNGQPYRGSAFVFKQTNGVWKQIANLTASDGYANHYFGNSVAITQDYVLVGAESSKIGNNLSQGAVYVFKRNGDNWTQVDKLVAPDGKAYAKFGSNMVIEGSACVISAEDDKVGNNNNQGSVYVYTFNGTSWVYTQKIVAADGSADDHFGYALSLNNNYLAVGIPYDDVNNKVDVGSVNMYIKSGNSFILNQKVLPISITGNTYMGWSVAVTTDTLMAALLTTPYGFVKTFVREGAGNVWEAKENITPISEDVPGEAFEFAKSMVFKDGYLFITYPGEQLAGLQGNGAVYVYKRVGSYFVLERRLIDQDGFFLLRFGRAVAFDGKNYIIGTAKNKVYFGSLED